MGEADVAYRSVRYRKQLEAMGGDNRAPLSIEDAIARLKKMAEVTADRSYKNGKKRKSKAQTVEIVLHLGIDARQADQMIRGAISLPKGLGKTRRVIAFCDGAVADEAREAGATETGAEELIKKIEGGWLDFDVAVAHPSMMGKVGKLGRILGPQGKMPTPKAGTVSQDILQAVRDFSGGRLEFRNDSGGNIHLQVGPISFPAEDLKANIEAVIAHITRMKPSSAKGQFIKRICLACTRSPSVTVTTSSAAA